MAGSATNQGGSQAGGERSQQPLNTGVRETTGVRARGWQPPAGSRRTTSYPTHAVRGHNDAMSWRGLGLRLRREEQTELGPRKAEPLDAGPLT
eukprot:298178-Pyramimonas_sp.AAC.1